VQEDLPGEARLWGSAEVQHHLKVTGQG